MPKPKEISSDSPESEDEGLTSIHPCIHCPATEEGCCLSEQDWKSVDRFLDILARVSLEIASRDASSQ
jgi:hypothetical protein